MNIRLILLSSIFGFSLLSCVTKKNGATEEKSNSNNNNVELEQANAGGDDSVQERTFFASINRGACYGKCPIYAMRIYSDGFVELTGTRFMEPIGEYTGKISKTQIQSFIDKANEIGFFALEEVYDSPVTDIPAITTSIVINGKQKTVMRRVGYPERIREFENLFDELLTTVKWQAVEKRD